MSSGIYSITHIASGKRYIGSSVNVKYRLTTHRRNLRKNCHPNPKLQSAWNKYGNTEFEFLPMLYCDKSQLFYYEQLCIDGFKPEYNIAVCADNPTRGRVMPQSLKDLWSSQRKGRKCSDEQREKLSEANMGHEVTEETRAKIRAGHLGKVLSEEHRQKLSEAHKGKQRSEEHRRAISEGNRRRYAARPAEEVEAMRLARKERNKEADRRYKARQKEKRRQQEATAVSDTTTDSEYRS